MEEFETTYAGILRLCSYLNLYVFSFSYVDVSHESYSLIADGNYTGMGNRDKEFMDKMNFDIHNVPDKYVDPTANYPDVTPKM